MKTISSLNKNILPYGYMALALFVSSLLLFSHDPYYGHDIGFHLSRIQSIADCFRNGSFPALIYPNYFSGYGYANGIFYPDLFLYIPGLMVYAGIDCKNAYRIFIFLLNIFTLLSFFFCIRKITKDTYTSAVVSCVYLLCSYRITDLYVRSALGEALCFVFVPFVLLGMYKILYENEKEGYWLIVGLVGILFSHIITLLFCVILIAIYYLFFVFRTIKRKEELFRRTVSLFRYCALSVGIGSYFIFPFIETLLSDTFLYQVSPATGGWERTLPFIQSIIEYPFYNDVYSPLGIGIVFLFLILILIRNRKTLDPFSSDSLIIGIFFLFLSTDLFPWIFFKNFAQTIQFPWRFLIISTVCLLFSCCKTLKTLFSDQKTKISLTAILIACTAFTFVCFAYNMYVMNDYKLYRDEIHYSVGGAEYLPADFDLNKTENKCLSNHEITISFDKKGSNIHIEYDNNLYDDTYIEVPLIYYKGYKAKENGKTASVTKGNDACVRVLLSERNGTLDIYYGLSNARIIGYAVSLISLITAVLTIKNDHNCLIVSSLLSATI